MPVFGDGKNFQFLVQSFTPACGGEEGGGVGEEGGGWGVKEPDDTCPAKGRRRHRLARVVLDVGGVQIKHVSQLPCALLYTFYTLDISCNNLDEWK